MPFGTNRDRVGDDSGGGVSEPSCRILVVDDSRSKLLSVESILSGRGYDLVLVDSGRAALKELLSHEFAAILLDIKMPDMDGFETAQLIRQHHRCEHTPIIFMTAFAEAEADMAQAYSLGAVDFIFAPFIPEILQAKVAVFAELFTKSAQVRHQSEVLRIEAEHRADALALRLDGLLNNLEVGVFQATLNGEVLSTNPAFERLLGDRFESDSLAGLVGGAESFRDLRDQLLSRGWIRGWAIDFRRDDGSRVWLSWTLSIRGTRGERLIEGVIEDISEQKRAEEALINKSEELARSNAQLENFAYAASHDMQEPLRTISLLASMLTTEYGTRIDERGRDWLSQLSTSSSRICIMIRDVLAFARAGRTGLEHTRVDLDRVLDRVLFSLGEAIRDSGAEVRIDVNGSISGNETLIEQLFQNLVGNALKFRSQEKLEVVISGTRESGQWTFEVRDNGIGIPEDQRENVFRLFHRLSGAGGREGSGIGLALCRRIVEHHGGEIWVQPSNDSGSSFRFTLRETSDQDCDTGQIAVGLDGGRSADGSSLRSNPVR